MPTLGKFASGLWDKLSLTGGNSFGGPSNVSRTVWQYAKAGIAALHIEDQVQTKRCGHLLGKQVVSREEFVTRIRAAVLARDMIPGGSDFVIIGRTDSAQVLGMDEALYRLKLAAAAGADVCFIEGVRTKELLLKTVAELAPVPVLVNVICACLSFFYLPVVPNADNVLQLVA
jgi:2-methylisocitrate lyase-like PEP mutase family enzyme